MLFLIWIFLHIVIITCLCLPFLLVCISLTRKKKEIGTYTTLSDFAIIITTYQNLEISIPLINSLLKQNYPAFHIYVVVDRNEYPIPDIIHQHLSFLIPPHPLDAKLRSIEFALHQFRQHHDSVIVMDPDNLAPAHFLRRMNDYIQCGFQVVQGKRIAKNLDTMYACIDALGEIYKTYLERWISFQLGGSANITGSGYAIKGELLREFVQKEIERLEKEPRALVVAEDKLLQNFLLQEGKRIAFAHDVYVYDEKVSSAYQVKRQRSRWILAYFQNMAPSLSLALDGVKKLDTGLILFAVLSLLPPLFILAGLSIFMAILDLFVCQMCLIAMLTALVVFGSTIIWTLKLSKAPAQIWKAIWGVPLFIFQQILALLKIGKARKHFLPTHHTHHTSIEEVEKGDLPVSVSETNSKSFSGPN